MKNLLLVLLVFATLSCGSAHADAYGGTAPAQPGPTGCIFAGASSCNWNTMNPVFANLGDEQDADFVVCFTNNGSFCSAQAANLITFATPQSGSVTTTVTVTQDSSTVLTTSHFCRSEMAGTLVVFPTGGPGGTSTTRKIVECIGSQSSGGSFSFSVDRPLNVIAGVSQTLLYGFDAAGFKQGQTIVVGAWSGGAVSGAVLTISSVDSGARTLTVSGNTGNVANNAAIHFLWGTDDSVGVTKACDYAANSGQKSLTIGFRQDGSPARHLVPSLGDQCYLVQLRSVDGAGLFGADDLMLPAVRTTGAIQELPIPFTAMPPAPAPNTLNSGRDFAVTSAAGASPVIVHTYDSLETYMPNQLTQVNMYPWGFTQAVINANAGITPTDISCGVGGGTMAAFDSTPAATFPPCINDTSTAWLTRIAAQSPDIVRVAGGNNDGESLSINALADSYLKLTGVGGTFTKVPDIQYGTHHPYTRSGYNSSGSGDIVSEQDEFSAGYLCSWAKVMSRQCWDGAREGIKALWGYDPLGLAFERRYDVPYGTNNISFPFQPEFVTRGYSVQIEDLANKGTTFWNRMTGNGGATDARGPFIAFCIGTHFDGSGNCDNVFWLFYNSGANTIGYECDPSIEVPGLGCKGANGAPPVTPSLLTNVTIANSGAGGRPVVTTSTAVLGPCVVGGTVAIPNAGTLLVVGGIGSIRSPYVDTVLSCDSTTQITLNSTSGAPNTFAARSGFVMFGNPVVNNGVTDVGLSTNPACGASCELFGVSVVGDTCSVWFMVQTNVVFKGPCVRSRNLFAGKIYSGGNRPNALTIATDSNGGTTYQSARRVPSLPMFIDAEVNGPSVSNPEANTGYIGPCGGDGNNHNCMGFGARVINGMYAANNFSFPSQKKVAGYNFTSNAQAVTLPANATILYAIARETAGHAVTISLGTTDGATDVATSIALTASTSTIIPITSFNAGKAWFSNTATQAIFIDSAAWNSANVNITIYYQVGP